MKIAFHFIYRDDLDLYQQIANDVPNTLYGLQFGITAGNQSIFECCWNEFLD